MTRSVAQRYARALFDAVGQPSQRDLMRKEMEMLVALLRDQPRLREALSHPGLSEPVRLDLIETVASRFSHLFRRFLALLVAEKRMDLLAEVLDVYRGICHDAEGVQPVIVLTSHRFGAELLARLEKRISAFLGKAVQVSVQIDPRVLGGIKIRYGDHEIDATVQSRLNRLQRAMAE